MPKPNSGKRGKIDNIKPTDDYKKKVMESFDGMVVAINKYMGGDITDDDLDNFEKQLNNLTNSKDTQIGIKFSDEYLNEILNDGRFKSQFETNKSKGLYDTEHRAKVEYDEMSYPKTIKNSERPIYGMLVNSKKLSKVDVSSKNGIAGHYGNVIALMKSDIKSYSTVTIGDSNDYYSSLVMPSPLLKASRYSYGLKSGAFKATIGNIKSGKTFSLKDVEETGDYIEAQIHKGRATVSNIQHLIFGKGAKITAAQKSRLKSLGITWSREGSNKIF